jgi:hypothetical protein
MIEDYDYYIEPCQLCISRNGATYDICGWCHDSDTHFKKRDGTFPGDWIKICGDRDSYPFHEMPHPTRKYYRDNKFIAGSEGLIPPNVTDVDIRTAQARNAAVSGILGIFESGARRTLDIKSNDANEFIKAIAEIEQELLLSSPKLDVTGKIEFRTLVYTLIGATEETKLILNELGNAAHKRNALSHPAVREAIAHESFHIIQAITTDSVGMRFDAARRLSILKWMLIEDFFFDRQGRVPFQTDAYELLHHIDQSSELYHYISRNFDYCRSDAKLISQYSLASHHFGLSMFDIIEGSALIFQKYIYNPTLNMSDILLDAQVGNIPSVYLNAGFYYLNNNGSDPLEFLLFCYCSLKYGLIPDESDFVNTPINPVSLFGYLCSLKNEHPNFLEFDGNIEVTSIFELRAILERMGYTTKQEFIKQLKNESADALTRFARTALKYKKVLTEIFTFLKHVGLDHGGYNNLKHLIASQQEVRIGQSNERLESVKSKLADDLAISDDDIIVPYLLSLHDASINLLLRINESVKGAKYTGAFGDETVTTDSENSTIDLIERIDDCMKQKKLIFCCETHGFVNYRKIALSSGPNCLNAIVNNRFSRQLTDMIGSESIRG